MNYRGYVSACVVSSKQGARIAFARSFTALVYSVETLLQSNRNNVQLTFLTIDPALMTCYPEAIHTHGDTRKLIRAYKYIPIFHFLRGPLDLPS